MLEKERIEGKAKGRLLRVTLGQSASENMKIIVKTGMILGKEDELKLVFGPYDFEMGELLGEANRERTTAGKEAWRVVKGLLELVGSTREGLMELKRQYMTYGKDGRGFRKLLVNTLGKAWDGVVEDKEGKGDLIDSQLNKLIKQFHICIANQPPVVEQQSTNNNIQIIEHIEHVHNINDIYSIYNVQNIEHIEHIEHIDNAEHIERIERIESIPKIDVSSWGECFGYGGVFGLNPCVFQVSGPAAMTLYNKKLRILNMYHNYRESNDPQILKQSFGVFSPVAVKSIEINLTFLGFIHIKMIGEGIIFSDGLPFFSRTSLSRSKNNQFASPEIEDFELGFRSEVSSDKRSAPLTFDPRMLDTLELNRRTANEKIDLKGEWNEGQVRFFEVTTFANGSLSPMTQLKLHN